jgi:hypothetical protein
MNEQEQLIDDLQRIESGRIQELTPELITVIELRFANNRLLNKEHQHIPNECTICHTDIDLIHHINSFNTIRTCNGDYRSFVKTLSIIFICPNCHYRIHNSNPYFTIQKLKR